MTTSLMSWPFAKWAPCPKMQKCTKCVKYWVNPVFSTMNGLSHQENETAAWNESAEAVWRSETWTGRWRFWSPTHDKSFEIFLPTFRRTSHFFTCHILTLHGSYGYDLTWEWCVWFACLYDGGMSSSVLCYGHNFVFSVVCGAGHFGKISTIFHR